MLEFFLLFYFLRFYPACIAWCINDHGCKYLLANSFRYIQALLHFIYWDALPDVEDIVDLSSKWASTLMAQHLLAASDRYALERLKLLCEANLCEDVAINTVATTLALADQHHCFQLKAVCLKFIASPENLKGIYTNCHNFSYD